MSAKLRSGVYLGRKSAVLLAVLLAALLLALLVLSVLLGRCTQDERRSRVGAAEEPGSLAPASSAMPGSVEPTARPGPWDAPRLPSAVLTPVHYSLLLWPHMAPGLPEPRTHSGQVNITLRCRNATNTVLLHSFELAYQDAAVWGPLEEGGHAGRSIPVDKLWFAPRHQYAVLELRENLSAGALFEVRLAFQGLIHAEVYLGGLFLNKYEDEGESRWLIASQLEPIAARSVYPCFDEPAMKATFNISIVHHPSYVALSNMPAIDVSEYRDLNESALNNITTSINWTITTFEITPKMSTYITAFVVCNFAYVSTTERGNKIRIWSKKDAIRDGYTEYALNITGPIFSYMEDLFNISYPLSKSDLIALPSLGAGAMENWGLMTFQDTSLFYQPQDKFTAGKNWIGRIISHEIAHQWFGNLVTMDWWNDLWLNEGFATYFEYVGVRFIESSVPWDITFSTSVVLRVLQNDVETAYQSVSVTDEEKQGEELIQLFSDVTYNKGAAIVQMLSGFMGEKLFIKALNSYLDAFSFSNANQDDLWDQIQKVIGEQSGLQLPAPVKVIMDTWTCQKGFPLLSVNLSNGVISQEQFLSKKGANHSNNMWVIPISWMRNGTMQPLIWLDKRSKVFPEIKNPDLGHDWIILNVNMSGFYRINYDQMYWRRLAKILEVDPKVIPVVNRVQLMEDAFHLQQSGYIDYDTPMYLTKYLEKEDSIRVWKAALHYLEVENWKYILSDYNSYPVLKKYFLPRMMPVYKHYASLLRQDLEILEFHVNDLSNIEYILAKVCWFGLRDCLELASEIFTKWMNNNSAVFPACASRYICCYGVQLGSEKEWEFAWKVYKQNETNWREKNNIMFALSCTSEPWLLQRFLQYTLNDSMISSSMKTEVFSNVARSENGHWIAWRFLTENWSNFCNRSRYDVLQTFVNTVSTDLEVQLVQVFLNNTLELNQRISYTDRLLKSKTEHEKIKASVIKMIKWIRKNMDG